MKISYEFRQTLRISDRHPEVSIYFNGKPLGNPQDDDYVEGVRFHDWFHLWLYAFSGWSPVTCKLNGQEVPEITEETPLMRALLQTTYGEPELTPAQKACRLEESLIECLLIEGSAHDFYANEVPGASIMHISREIAATTPLSRIPDEEWHESLPQAFAIYRQLVTNYGGIVDVDPETRSFQYRLN